MAGFSIVGLILLLVGLYFLFTGNIVIGAILIVLALLLGGGGYYRGRY